jgi:hypothetical protein
MRRPQYQKIIALLLVSASIYLATPRAAHGQAASGPSICEEAEAPSSLKNALRQVCLRKPAALAADSTLGKAIIIGFVGGFVRHDDARHPEVHFAAYLRDRYPAGIHAQVFSNHEGHEALRQILSLLDADGDGVLTAAEKEQARIIIYGHSWGASETVALARQLGQKGIPVLLTIQVDSIAKPGQKDSTIPPNVAKAINFYQPGGLLHGRSEILAADPARTKILGNFRMTYEGHPINCDNYPWFARTFNKPHHEIENDPRVWDNAASLIESELSSPKSTPKSTMTSLGGPEGNPFKK